MGGNSGGGGSGGRSGGGGASGGGSSVDYDAQISMLQSELAKTNRALDVARDSGTREERKMLRELSRTLDNKIRDTEYNRDTAKAEASYQKWLKGGKKGLEPSRTGIRRLW